jgi:hypothetical protein
VVDLAAGRGDVATGAPYRGRVDVRGMQLDVVQRHGQRRADRARATAQVNHDSSWPGHGSGLADQELGAASGDEDPGVHGYPKAAELSPAEDVLKGQAGGPPVHHGGEFGWRPRRGDEQLRFVLGEDTAGGRKPGDDDGSRAR